MKKFKHWGLKRRQLPDHNYNALWLGDTLKTIRFGEGHAKDLPYTCKEFFDIAVNNRCNLLCPFCLVPDTNIKTISGEKPISSIKIGDIVKSFNSSTKEIEEKQVTQLYEREISEDIFEIEDDNGNIIKLTSNHKVFTNRGWIEAKNLKEKDEILNY
jgi:hypothetical protein